MGSSQVWRSTERPSLDELVEDEVADEPPPSMLNPRTGHEQRPLEARDHDGSVYFVNERGPASLSDPLAGGASSVPAEPQNGDAAP